MHCKSKNSLSHHYHYESEHYNHNHYSRGISESRQAHAAVFATHRFARKYWQLEIRYLKPFPRNMQHPPEVQPQGSS